MSETPPNDASKELDGLEETTIPVRADDATIVVSHDEGTIAVPTPGGTPLAEAGMRPVPHPVAARNASHATPRPATRSTTGGDPVEEPQEIPEELAKLLFKNPLDPKRRAPESPFPREQSSLPRGGVRAGIPVAYGARAEEFQAMLPGTNFAERIGPPPASYELPETPRATLPSLARLNRRFSWLAWAGSVTVPLVVGLGLWGVVTLLLRT